MDGFLILLAGAVLIVPFVLPIVAMRRTRRIASFDERLRAMEDRLIEVSADNLRLRAAVEELERAPRVESDVPAESMRAPVPTAAPPPPPMAPEAAALAALDALASDARREAADTGAGAVSESVSGTVSESVSGTVSESVSDSGTVSDSGSGSGSGSVPESATVSDSGSGSVAEPERANVPPPPAINWEQWLGVRGAAALGGIVLALAGILFFQYSIQHGLISPAMRVVIGTIAGVGCLIASARMRQYGTSANALGGAGAVILYACFWAARGLYQLIPMEAAFVLMGLTTAVTALFAARFGSILIAALGLTGGFLTPLLLSTGANKPIGLFGYLLVLDSGFLLVAFRRRWGGLALFALAGTLLLEALWIGNKMEPGQLAIGLGATGLFAVLFLASGARAPKDGPRPMMWIATQATAVLLPHAFALYFALDAHLGHHLYPIALLLLLLELAALHVAGAPGAEPQLAFLPTAAGAGSLAVVASWLGHARLTTTLGWEAAAICVALALPAVISALLRRTSDVPALLYPGGLFFVLFAAAVGDGIADPWPFVVGLAALTALLVSLARGEGRAPLALVAPGLLGAALAGIGLSQGEHPGFPRIGLYLAAELALFILAYAYALRTAPRKDALARRSIEGALLLGALPLLGLAAWDRFLSQPAVFVFWLPVGWTILLILAVVVRGDGRWLVAAAFPALLVHGFATSAILEKLGKAPIEAVAACAAAVVLFTRAPLLRWPRLFGRASFYVAALAGLAWLLPSLALYRDHFGTTGQGGVPLLYAAFTLALVPEIRARFSLTDPVRKSALVWVAAAALGLLSIAIPVELERQWITIGYALETAALLLLWEHLDHPGLKYFALGLTGAVAARLCLNTSVLAYSDRGSTPIFNWVLYTYWVPVIALLVGLRALQPRELVRLRSWELGLYATPSVKEGEDPRASARQLGVIFLGFSVIAIVFVWINLAIADWFGTSATLTLDFERKPARDLTISIAWALYAIVLLALGVWRRSSALRKVSLAMLVVTILKVFLYDLGELKDLYRVVSLLGLAVSLIGVSLAYQRFVFRRASPPDKRP